MEVWDILLGLTFRVLLAEFIVMPFFDFNSISNLPGNIVLYILITLLIIWPFQNLILSWWKTYRARTKAATKYKTEPKLDSESTPDHESLGVQDHMSSVSESDPVVGGKLMLGMIFRVFLALFIAVPFHHPNSNPEVSDKTGSFILLVLLVTWPLQNLALYWWRTYRDKLEATANYKTEPKLDSKSTPDHESLGVQDQVSPVSESRSGEEQPIAEPSSWDGPAADPQSWDWPLPDPAPSGSVE